MKVLHIQKYGRLPILKDIPIPAMKSSNQVLVKMKYAPINPSDIHFYMGRYGVKKQGFPIAGFQGSGIIEEAHDKALIGKNVSVLAGSSNGTHSTHLVSDLNKLVVWDRDVNLQKISMVWINPFSCVGLFHLIQRYDYQNVILSGAASQLNLMMIALIRKLRPLSKVYGLTRNGNYRTELIEKGYNDIFSTTDQFSEKFQLTSKTIFLDCVGGEFAGKVFNSMPNDSQMVSYGRLSGESLAGIDAGSLYYKNKKIRGFWLNNWLNEVNELEFKEASNQIKDNFEAVFEQKTRKIYPLADFNEAYHESIRNQSQGKILLDLS